jgi:hypothetical protein
VAGCSLQVSGNAHNHLVIEDEDTNGHRAEVTGVKRGMEYPTEGERSPLISGGIPHLYAERSVYRAATVKEGWLALVEMHDAAKDGHRHGFRAVVQSRVLRGCS